jgi:radical SAM protein with 4Fe4S-binding SPASM domain
MSVGLYITTRCDLKCRYCFNWESDEKKGGRDLEYPDICQILAAGREKGHRYLTLTGGEPFVHKDIFKIIDYAYDIGYLVDILTNGLLIDEYTAEKLGGKCRLRIRVSLEGASKKIHEYFRGENTFEPALQAIGRLIENNIIVGIGFTVYEENLDEIEKTVRLGIELGCTFVRFSPVVRILKGKQAKINFNLHENTLTKIIAAQIKYKADILFPGSGDKDFSLPIEAFTTKRCEAGSNFFAISPGKIILPCPLILSSPGITGKKFTGKHDFDVITEQMEDLFDDIAGRLKGRCATCEFSKNCVGGCPAEKLSFDLTLYDEQPVCAKRILKKVEHKFNKSSGKNNNNVMQLLKKSWMHGINSSSCFRQAPFWMILLKPGRK